ncbi:MAG: hypothetical protein HYT64_00775 [Candidatus Yanofskybacteria bacterium]|nr:hypothetical protein [Candidatus Yanofskybacteria bacterium]
MNIETFIHNGVLRFAREPKDNPSNLNFPGYTVPLIEHDYPAKTPAMWNAAYREFGMEAGNVMLVGDPERIPEIFAAFRQDPKYLGGGAGVGFKDEAVKHLDGLDPLASEIGSVNLILKTSGGALKGFNTDGLGYAQSLENVFKARGKILEGKKAVILGAGGTGNAVAFALAGKGMQLVILNRTVEKAEVLAGKLNDFFMLKGKEWVRFGGEELIGAEVSDADTVINVSTKGAAGDFERYSALAPAKLPAAEENIRENLEQAARVLAKVPKTAVVSDIVLGKEPTPFLKAAAQAGFETLDGVAMVINQGVEAFWLIHGKETRQKGFTKKHIREVMERAASA